MERTKNIRIHNIDNFPFPLEGSAAFKREGGKIDRASMSILQKIAQEWRLYVTLFDKAPDGYLITDAMANIQEANREAAFLLAVSQSDLIGESVDKFMREEERLRFRAQLERLQNVSQIVSMEVTLTTPQGTAFPAALTMYVIRDSEQEEARLGIVLRNVTDSQRLRQAWQECERLSRTVFETSGDGLVMTTANGKIVAINPAGEGILGYEPKELDGQDILLFYANVAAHNRLRQCLEAVGTLRDYEVKLRRKNGEECDCLCTSTVWRASDGSIEGYCSIFRDITGQKRLGTALIAARDELENRVAECTAELQQRTRQLQVETLERRRAEDALRESNEQFYNLLAGSNQGILVHRDDHPFFVNQAFADIFGYDRPEDILGLESLWVLVAPHERERLEGYHRTGLHGKDTSLRYEYQGVRKNGLPIWVENNMTLIHWEGTEAIQSSIVDVTRRHQLERDLQQSRDKLWKLAAHLHERQEEERKHIAREIHDELGQVLTSLKIDAVYLASQKTEMPKSCQDRLTIMTTQIDSLIDTVRRIGTELHPHMLDDLGLVAAMEHLLQDVRRRTDMIYRLSLPSEELLLEPLRAAAIFRIFQEALTNVVRHARATMISVRLFQQFNMLRLEVCDNGQGIALKQLESREAFGLRSMRERAALWDGTVEIHGNPDKGTKVVVCMPSGFSHGKEEMNDAYSRR